MPKNIVLCSDGTGQSGGKGNQTNVWRIYKSVATMDFKAPPTATEDAKAFSQKAPPLEQRIFYDDGVGTSRIRWWALFCGIFGYGLSRNVKQLYATLAANFDPGDHIYLFGFSRGAFTVRTLAGLIDACGVVDRRHPEENRFLDDAELEAVVDTAYKAYRQKYSALLCRVLKQLLRVKDIDLDDFRSTNCIRVTQDQYKDYKNIPKNSVDKNHVPIRFIGVWDTVDAVGFPVDCIANFWNKKIYQFKFSNYALGDGVDKACHALAIDEERGSFQPRLFDQRPHKDGRVVGSSPVDDGRIEQVWFPGVHSNVGGGYPKQGMAHVTLNWMMAKAEEQGLRFDKYYKTRFQAAANIQDKLYDSRSGLSVYYRYKPRNLKRFAEYTPIKIHVSAFHRILACTDNYAPGHIVTFQPEVNDPTHSGETPDYQTGLVTAWEDGLANFGDDYHQPVLVKARSRLHGWFTLASFLVLAAGFTLDKLLGPVGHTHLLLKVVKSVATEIPWVGPPLYNAILEPLFRNPILGLVIIAIPLLFYWRGRVLMGKQNRYYQSFWRKTLNAPWWEQSSKPFSQIELKSKAASPYRIENSLATTSQTTPALAGKAALEV
jgi:uncharacterized protein (DUF2235 family)